MAQPLSTKSVSFTSEPTRHTHVSAFRQPSYQTQGHENTSLHSEVILSSSYAFSRDIPVPGSPVFQKGQSPAHAAYRRFPFTPEEEPARLWERNRRGPSSAGVLQAQGHLTLQQGQDTASPGSQLSESDANISTTGWGRAPIDCLLTKPARRLRKQGARAEPCFAPKADTRNISTQEGDKLKQLPPGQTPGTVNVTQGSFFLQIHKQKHENPCLQVFRSPSARPMRKNTPKSCFAVPRLHQ